MNRVNPSRSRACASARAGVLVLGLALPYTAHAHLVSSGVGPFYDGLAHFLVSPEDFVVVLGLALVAGLSSVPAAQWLIRTLPFAWLLGAAVGAGFPSAAPNYGPAAATMILTGLTLAARPKLPAGMPAAIGVAVGLLHGFLNGQSMAATNTSFVAAWGIAAALATVALCVAAFATTIRAYWQLIAARTLGSWIAAIGLLMLGWLVRGAGG